MFVGITKKLFSSSQLSSQEERYQHYLTYGYPSNHTYKISHRALSPKYKLAKRYKKIRRLFPEPLTSFVEIGCSKGFFVFSAGAYPDCTRSLGIDVNNHDIEICLWVKDRIKHSNTSFKLMQLHELAESIHQFGGPFQTVLILNTYQYLYFGSDTVSTCYLNHDVIFGYLRKICSHRIIFNNRIELEDCQNTARIAVAKMDSEFYTEKNLLSAAEKYFAVQKHGKIGQYPLFTFDVK